MKYLLLNGVFSSVCMTLHLVSYYYNIPLNVEFQDFYAKKVKITTQSAKYKNFNIDLLS